MENGLALCQSTLVAVFALAAFLSVGFLLIGNDGQVAEAQDASCEVTVGTDTDNVRNRALLHNRARPPMIPRP